MPGAERGQGKSSNYAVVGIGATAGAGEAGQT
jgi:hypothetical protein